LKGGGSTYTWQNLGWKESTAQRIIAGALGIRRLVIASQSYWVVVKLGCQEFVAGVWIGLFFFLHSKPNKALLLVLSFRGKKGQKGLFSFPIFLMQEMLKIFNFKKKKFPKEKKNL